MGRGHDGVDLADVEELLDGVPDRGSVDGAEERELVVEDDDGRRPDPVVVVGPDPRGDVGAAAVAREEGRGVGAVEARLDGDVEERRLVAQAAAGRVRGAERRARARGLAAPELGVPDEALGVEGAAQPAGEGRPGQAVARVGVADRPPQRLAVVVRLVRSSALRDAVVEGAAVDARRDPALELRVELVGVDVDVEGAAAREGVDRGLDAGQRGPGPESVEVDDDVDDVVLLLLRRREGRLRRLREGALLLELGQRPRRRARRAQGPRPRVLAAAGLAGDDLVVRVVVEVLPLLVAERRAHGAPRAAPNDGRSSSRQPAEHDCMFACSFSSAANRDGLCPRG